MKVQEKDLGSVRQEHLTTRRHGCKRDENLHQIGMNKKIRNENGNIVRVHRFNNEETGKVFTLFGTKPDGQTVKLPGKITGMQLEALGRLTRVEAEARGSVSKRGHGKVAKMSLETAGQIRDEMKIVDVPHCIGELGKYFDFAEFSLFFKLPPFRTLQLL